MKNFMHPIIYDREFKEQKSKVTRNNHFKVLKPPHNWQDMQEYANWRNSNLDLCGFVQFDDYLTTTVY